MMKSVRMVGIIAIMGIMVILAYRLGTAQGEATAEARAVAETMEAREAERAVEAMPDGHAGMTPNDFYSSCVDMDMVVDFSADEYGLQLYFEDGTGYYWER